MNREKRLWNKMAGAIENKRGTNWSDGTSGDIDSFVAGIACAEIAHQEAIEFAEWCMRQGWGHCSADILGEQLYLNDSGLTLSIADLYSLFKQIE